MKYLGLNKLNQLQISLIYFTFVVLLGFILNTMHLKLSIVNTKIRLKYTFNFIYLFIGYKKNMTI